jgi:hypothetical protein
VPQSWKRRYFVLRTDKLLYYHKDDKDPLSVGVIDLEKCAALNVVPLIKVRTRRMPSGTGAHPVSPPARTAALTAPGGCAGGRDGSTSTRMRLTL